MKRIIVLLALFLFCSDYVLHASSKNSCLSLRVKKIRYCEKRYKTKYLFFAYDITIELKNISDTVVSFRYYECSWQESFVFDHESFYLQQYDCPTNRGFYIDLEPGECKIFNGLLIGRFTPDQKIIKNFKLGFVFIEPSYNSHCSCDKNDYALIKRKEDWKCIIWSKEYRIKTKRHKRK